MPKEVNILVWRTCYRAGTHRYKSAYADLYHIELERSESISNLPQGKYIEPSESEAYRQDYIFPQAKEDRERKNSLSFSVCVENCSITGTLWAFFIF
jgi:hypothetical protein